MNGQPLRIAVAGLMHETNTFAPGVTDLQTFQNEWMVGREAFLQRYAGTGTSMGGVIQAAKEHDAELLPGLYTAATPSGIVNAAAAGELVADVVESIDVTADGLLLILHGAMVSEQYSDMEGELLRKLRARLGSDFPIALTLDLHANITADMVALSDIIVGYDTYPHVDMFERAMEAFDLLERFLRRRIHPVHAYAHTGMLVVPQGMMTAEGSMKRLMERAFELETDERVLNVTVAGGFPYSDVPDAGMSFVVTTDGEQELANQYAAELVRLARKLRYTFQVPMMKPMEAVSSALADTEGLVVICEGSDNVGGGAPADATHVLKHLVGIPQKALIVICDPEAVRAAFSAGVGAVIKAAVGGKSGSQHGEPVSVEGKIRMLFDGIYHHIGPYMTGQRADMGQTAVLECGFLTVLLTSNRTAPWDLGHIRAVGLSPEDFKLIVVKSAIAWQTAFGGFAKRVIHLDTPGCCSMNLSHFQYHHVRRPVFPLDKIQNE